MIRKTAAFIIVLSSLATFPAWGAQKPWTEVKSPHFTVITDGSQGDARNVAAEFEQMRYVFANRYPGFRLDSGAPVVIMAARDLETAKKLEPRVWKHYPNMAGEFHHGWEKQFVAIRLDTWGVGAHEVVYHEYAHSIFHLNAHWLPTWLDEGLAEFYGYTRFQSNKIYIGAPSERFAILKSRPLIPVEKLINSDGSATFSHDEEESQMFYAESWALVHYTMFGQGMKGGQYLNQFYNLLQRGVPQKEAFLQVFGSFAQMDKSLAAYVNRFEFNAGVIPTPSRLDKKSFAVRKLSVAETELDLGAFHIGEGDRATGERLIDAALQGDPKLGAAHEEKGYLLFGEGEDAAALKEFTTAYALDNTLYRSLYAKTMLSPEASSTDPPDEAAYRADLQRVTDLNPKYAPAFVELAELAMREHDYHTAFNESRQAESLAPFRAGYHLLTGQILLADGRPAEAAKFAEFVANRWIGPDHDEAVVLWNSVPAAQRPQGVTLSFAPFQKQDKFVSGTIRASSCGDAKTPYTLVLMVDGKSLTFDQPHGFPVGFSDTLWYGADHFSLCHHLEGKRAVLYYTPSTDAKFSGELMELEIRDAISVPRPAPDTTPKQATAAAQ